MPQVVKNYSIQFRGLTISPDGQTIGATVAWQDEGSQKPNITPGSIKHLRINAKTGSVEINNASVGTIDAATLKNAAAVASSLGALIQSLATSGKIPTP